MLSLKQDLKMVTWCMHLAYFSTADPVVLAAHTSCILALSWSIQNANKGAVLDLKFYPQNKYCESKERGQKQQWQTHRDTPSAPERCHMSKVLICCTSWHCPQTGVGVADFIVLIDLADAPGFVGQLLTSELCHGVIHSPTILFIFFLELIGK